ncbi:hypothetical protein C4B63_97g12 [Trypanosoma cruzi]|uniref:Uncharacterized protein n=1 Tax=Trypanosoma cruzi TaxID=5693 RepID=A0A2V2US90_TRYCR|nr:hypothetical protein C4B63_97g12 [Trypanosoma cruzi]
MSAHANAAYLWATAAYPRTKHVMHKPRRHPTSHSSQAHGAPASFSLAEGIIRARQLKPEARRSTVSGDWELTRTDATLTRGGEAALARFRSGVSHTIRMAATTTATRHPTKMLLARRGCRTAGTQRICTETPPPPAGPHHATIRRPADCPVCGKHCSCRISFVTHMVNACGITRPLRRCGNLTFAVNRDRQKSHWNHRLALGVDESERRCTDRTSATQCTAQPEVIPLLGFVQPTKRTRFSSSTLPQLGLSPDKWEASP